MMATAILYYVQSLWPIATFKNDDLRQSDALVRQLEIPDETKRFVFAIREPESQAVIYILCAQNLSERSAIDAERLIRCVKPGAVIALVNEVDFENVQSLSDGENEHPIPTSSLEVLKRCFLHKIGKDKYENVAGSLVLKEIFGVGFNGHFSSAKRVAEEIGSSFLLLESPFVQLERDDNSSSEIDPGNNFLSLQPNNLMPQRITSIIPSSLNKHLISDDHIRSQTLKFLSSNILQLNPNPTTTSIQPKENYEPPQYANSVYPLLQDLHNIFLEIPSIRHALAHAQTLLDDVSKGDNIDTKLLSEVYAFRIAVEGLRIALNNSGRIPITKTTNQEFSNLTDQEKSHALLSHALKSQTKSHTSIVAILDASTLSGLRKHWNTIVPQEIENTIEELVAESANGENETANQEKKRKLTNKPVVAVGAGATAVLGASSLSKVVPASSFIKVVTFKIPFSLKLIMTQTHKLISISLSKILGPYSKVIAPSVFNSGLNTTSSMKAAVSAEKIRTVVHSVIASAEKTSLSAMRTAFYEIMRKRRVRPVGVLPWVTFGGSVVTCSGLLVCGDGIECAVESVPCARSIASLGRGVERLREVSKEVEKLERFRIQTSIESLVKKFKKWKVVS